MGRKSKTKGKVGEREWAHFLSARGFASRRGQQFAGSPDSPDVVTDCLPGVHWECKRCESGNPYDWLAQAHADAAGKLPIVAHRRNDCRWLCIMDAETLCEIIRRSELVTREVEHDGQSHDHDCAIALNGRHECSCKQNKWHSGHSAAQAEGYADAAGSAPRSASDASEQTKENGQ